MLKKPYKLFHQEGLNDYYLATLNDLEVYLGIVTLSIFQKYTRFPFIFKRRVEVPTVTKLQTLPIDSHIMWLLITYLSINPTKTEESVEDGKVINYYDSLSELDNRDIVEGLKSFIEDSGVTLNNLEFNKYVKNPVAKGFIKQGFHYYVTTAPSTISRTHWCYRLTKYGVLQIVEINETGYVDDSVTREVNTYLLNKDLVTKIIMIIEKTYGGEEKE